MQGPSAWNIVANTVVIEGSNGYLLVYSGSPEAGNLIASIAGEAFTDAYGNNVLQGVGSYQASFASALNAGSVEFYTGSLSGGWSLAGEIETDSEQDMLLYANGSIYANGNLIG